mmetsp:Transcript_53230/g.120015  ORF Transcript_53230/g.120015 Transcript_53230/m.120015 type:complete len:345 (-) Transcript_53230:794-1828(-)
MLLHHLPEQEACPRPRILCDLLVVVVTLSDLHRLLAGPVELVPLHVGPDCAPHVRQALLDLAHATGRSGHCVLCQHLLNVRDELLVQLLVLVDGRDQLRLLACETTNVIAAKLVPVRIESHHVLVLLVECLPVEGPVAVKRDDRVEGLAITVGLPEEEKVVVVPVEIVPLARGQVHSHGTQDLVDIHQGGHRRAVRLCDGVDAMNELPEHFTLLVVGGVTHGGKETCLRIANLAQAIYLLAISWAAFTWLQVVALAVVIGAGQLCEGLSVSHVAECIGVLCRPAEGALHKPAVEPLSHEEGRVVGALDEYPDRNLAISWHAHGVIEVRHEQLACHSAVIRIRTE